MLSMLNCENLSTKEGKELIRAIVSETVRELRKAGILRRNDDVAYSEMSSRLFEFYRNPGNDPALEEALEKLKIDDYFDIIPQYYKQRIAVDWIAEAYRCDVSTITRNKKRLCMTLWRLVWHEVEAR